MITLVKGIGGLVIASTILAGCGGSGELSGNLFLGVGGQARGGADVEVLLVPVTAQVETQLKQLESDFEREMAPVKRLYEEARHDADTLYKELMSGMRSLFPGYAEALLSQANSFSIEQAWKVDEVRSRYQERIVSLFREHGGKSTRTGVDGAYTFTGVPRGKVLVLAQWNTRDLIGGSDGGQRVVGVCGPGAWWPDVPDVLITWLVPAEVKRGANRLDLSGSNAGAFWRRWDGPRPLARDGSDLLAADERRQVRAVRDKVQGERRKRSRRSPRPGRSGPENIGGNEHDGRRALVLDPVRHVRALRLDSARPVFLNVTPFAILRYRALHHEGNGRAVLVGVDADAAARLYLGLAASGSNRAAQEGRDWASLRTRTTAPPASRSRPAHRGRGGTAGAR
jgi:hypothetical protein